MHTDVLYMHTDVQFLSYLAHFFLEWEMFQTKFVKKIKTHFMFKNSFLENRAVYEIMRKNIYSRLATMTKWRIRIACWVLRL